MPAPISGISHHLPITPVRTPTAASQPGAFENVLESAIQNVEKFQQEAAHKVEQLLSGESEELHSAALATQKAELVFDLGLQIRNKVVDAYQEVMKMQM